MVTALKRKNSVEAAVELSLARLLAILDVCELGKDLRRQGRVTTVAIVVKVAVIAGGSAVREPCIEAGCTLYKPGIETRCVRAVAVDMSNGSFLPATCGKAE